MHWLLGVRKFFETPNSLHSCEALISSEAISKRAVSLLDIVRKLASRPTSAGLDRQIALHGATPAAPCNIAASTAGSLTVLFARLNTPPALPTSQKNGFVPFLTALHTTYWW